MRQDSLIPKDVLQAWNAEAAAREPVTGPIGVPPGLIPRGAPLPRRSPGVAATEEHEIPSVEVAGVMQMTVDHEVALLALSQVAEFQKVPRTSLSALADGAMQLEVRDGEELFREGDEAESFFVVVDGTLEILRTKHGREVALRHISRGEAIGLFGLFSGQQRAACARAIGDVVLLEIPATALQKLVELDPVLNDRLLRFYQERILEGFLGSSKLFSDVDSIARARMIGKFAERTLKEGDVLMQPGEVANLIMVVTHGSMMLEERARSGLQPKHYEITQGQFLAVTSAMSGIPGRLKLFAPGPAQIVILNHREMADLVRDYPALRALTGRLPDHARMLERDVYCGHTGVPGL